MFFKTSSVALLVLSQVATITGMPVKSDSKAAEVKHSSKSFSIQAHANSHRVRNGPRALRKSLAKHNLAIPENLAKLDMDALSQQLKAIHEQHIGKRQSSVAASSNGYYDTEYVCPVTIGGQTLLLDFDTGSSDLWVFSDRLTSRQRGSHTVYSTKQGFRQMSNYYWRISYGDGSGASGLVGTDTVSIGNATVTSQAVEIATSVSSQFTADTANNGLLGLGFGTINTVRPYQQKTWFENVKSQLRLPLFTANLKHGATGSYDFGFINSTSYNGTVQYANVTRQRYWEFNAPTFKVGNTTYNTTAGTTAIADTGTTLLIVPSAMAQTYYSQVPNATYNNNIAAWTFPCNAILPNLTLSVGNVPALIPGGDLNFGYATPNSCYGGLQGTSGSLGIYGDIFFKRYFTVFDYGSLGYPRVGIAPKF